MRSHISLDISIGWGVSEFARSIKLLKWWYRTRFSLLHVVFQGTLTTQYSFLPLSFVDSLCNYLLLLNDWNWFLVRLLKRNWTWCSTCNPWNLIGVLVIRPALSRILAPTRFSDLCVTRSLLIMQWYHAWGLAKTLSAYLPQVLSTIVVSIERAFFKTLSRAIWYLRKWRLVATLPI